MADSVEQLREEWGETDRLEKEEIDKQHREGLLIDLINSGVKWLAVPDDTQSGQASPEQSAMRLAEAVAIPEIRHGAEIVAKFMRARLDSEDPGEGRNRRKAVVNVIEYTCDEEIATVAELLDAGIEKSGRETFRQDFSDAWLAIHVCRKFDSYDQIADCRDFAAVRSLDLRRHEEPAGTENGAETETPTDSGRTGDVLPTDPQMPAAPPGATDEPELTVSEDWRTVRWAKFPDSFTFTTNQAKCFEILYRNWQSGAQWLHQSTILDGAGTAPSSRLSTVFRNGKHPAWGTLITPEPSGLRGMFGLAAELPKKLG